MTSVVLVMIGLGFPLPSLCLRMEGGEGRGNGIELDLLTFEVIPANRVTTTLAI